MISASPHGGKEEAPPHTLSQLLFQLCCRGKKGSGGSRGRSDSMILASPHGGRGSCGSLSCRRQRWKLTHQLWVDSQTRIKDAQTVRFRSQSCHVFRLSLQRLLTRSRRCYFSFAAGGEGSGSSRGSAQARFQPCFMKKGKSAAFFFQKHKTAETLPYFTCSSPETAAACFTGFG